MEGEKEKIKFNQISDAIYPSIKVTYIREPYLYQFDTYNIVVREGIEYVNHFTRRYRKEVNKTEAREEFEIIVNENIEWCRNHDYIRCYLLVR